MQYGMEELVPSVARLAERYTGMESSSVTYEKAEQLMQAVLYTIDELRFSGGEYTPAVEMPALKAYETGYDIICNRVCRCQEAYNDMIGSFDAYGNRFYHDTVVDGLPKFFLYYDARFAPQDHILTLDYITGDFDTKLSGIDQIAAYLDSIITEQKFLSRFPRKYVIDVLVHWNEDYRDLPVNVAAAVQESLV